MYEYNFETRRGATFKREIYFENGTGVAIPLIGKTAQGEIRPKAGSDELTASFACSVDAVNGILTISLTSTQTAAMSPGTYAYDVALIDGENVDYWLGGSFTVKERVTEVTNA